jgi:signal transduction histidine kinase
VEDPHDVSDSPQHGVRSATPRRFAATVAISVALLGLGTTALFAWQAHQGGRRARQIELDRLALARGEHGLDRLEEQLQLLHTAAAGTAIRADMPGYRQLVTDQLAAQPGLLWAGQACAAVDATARVTGCEHPLHDFVTIHRRARGPGDEPRARSSGRTTRSRTDRLLEPLLHPDQHCQGHTAHVLSDLSAFGGDGPGVVLLEHLHGPTAQHARDASRSDSAWTPGCAVILVYELDGLLGDWQITSALRVACTAQDAATARGVASWQTLPELDAVEFRETFRLADLELGTRRREALPPLETADLVHQILTIGIPSSALFAGLLAWILDVSRRRATACQLDAEAGELARRHLETRAMAFETAIQGREAELGEAREALLHKARELIKASRQLARRTREIESFYHTVSHELRTPLTAIREFLSIVDDELVGPINDEQRDCIRSAEDSCVQMQRCIDDLFDAARSETGKLELLPEPTDLGRLLHQVVQICAQAANRHRVAVLGDAPDLPTAHVDPGRILQVLTNLIDNAVKFSPADGVVRVHAEVTGTGRTSEVLFQVTDEGPGIAPDELARVFDRLHQVRTDELQTRGGLGLGLSLCRCLIERHGGRIGLDSVLGRGTTAWFTLPLDLGGGTEEPSLLDAASPAPTPSASDRIAASLESIP